ncbi:MAG TPA: DUF1232 domain-containing protein, partial [Caldilineae bacterium]|nr:DUF1232 domain-containing protein [Caldilineae bacterium]
STFIRLLEHLKLSWKLFRDPSVSALVRYGIPILGLIYLISPVDVIPDVLLGFGQLDDAAVLLLLSQLIVMLAPADIVARYQQAARGAAPAAGEADASQEDDEVIDADYRVIP